MDSFLFKKGNTSAFATPVPSKHNHNSNRPNLISVTTLSTPMHVDSHNHNQNTNPNLHSPLHPQQQQSSVNQSASNQCSANNNPNSKRANNYDYLDYGAYINRVLSAQLSAHTTSDPINWNLPRTSDKVNMVNAMLSILESKKLYESLLEQSRDTINCLKSEVHSSESKNQQLHSHNKQLSARIKTLLQRKEQMEQQSKRKESAWKDKVKSAQKEIEGLAYRDKTYQHNMRRQEKVHKAQRE